MSPVEISEAMVDAALDGWFGEYDWRQCPSSVEVARMRRALEAALAVQAPTVPGVPETRDAGGWMPIDTAPKDGTIVDILCMGAIRAFDCRWQSHKWRDPFGLPIMHSSPTHWIPRPPPPGSDPLPNPYERAAKVADDDAKRARDDLEQRPKGVGHGHLMTKAAIATAERIAFGIRALAKEG